MRAHLPDCDCTLCTDACAHWRDEPVERCGACGDCIAAEELQAELKHEETYRDARPMWEVEEWR